MSRHERLHQLEQRISRGEYAVPVETVALAVWRVTARAVSVFGRHQR